VPAIGARARREWPAIAGLDLPDATVSRDTRSDAVT